MTDCAIESENEREWTQLMIFFELNEVIFSNASRHKIFSAKTNKKQHSYLREQQIRPREKHSKFEREKKSESAFVWFGSFRRIFCTKNWITAEAKRAQQSISEKKRETINITHLLNFVNYLSRREKSKQKKSKHTVLLRARARESETWVIS